MHQTVTWRSNIFVVVRAYRDDLVIVVIQTSAHKSSMAKHPPASRGRAAAASKRVSNKLRCVALTRWWRLDRLANSHFLIKHFRHCQSSSRWLVERNECTRIIWGWPTYLFPYTRVFSERNWGVQSWWAMSGVPGTPKSDQHPLRCQRESTLLQVQVLAPSTTSRSQASKQHKNIKPGYDCQSGLYWIWLVDSSAECAFPCTGHFG
jgi:hypothetical protein